MLRRESLPLSLLATQANDSLQGSFMSSLHFQMSSHVRTETYTEEDTMQSEVLKKEIESQMGTLAVCDERSRDMVVARVCLWNILTILFVDSGCF
ncbi:uncharacterized protein ARMOST_22074 [Armillaria ostoyae]|uniref:Uncharacterized protein n=1 Tax=Armillaria ostoyae TaxID=47428 RepID=A0A284SBW4_ARMOS|nr:uncharacterized protein ARMOST_22074 [Armillaria ostoyae]